MSNIKRIASRRVITLLAVMALAVSGLTSMAGLTSNLAVGVDIQGVNAAITGNGTPTTVSLFPAGQVIMPTTPLFAKLSIKNEGNVIVKLTNIPAVVTGTDTLKTDALWTVYTNTNLNVDPTSPCSATPGTGWQKYNTTPVAWGSGIQNVFQTPVDTLSVGQSAYMCFVVTSAGGSGSFLSTMNVIGTKV